MEIREKVVMQKKRVKVQMCVEYQIGMVNDSPALIVGKFEHVQAFSHLKYCQMLKYFTLFILFFYQTTIDISHY